MNTNPRGVKRRREPSGTSLQAGSVGDTSAEPEPGVPSSSHACLAEPTDLNVIAFAEKRSREIRTLLNILSTKAPKKRLFQQLPRHMRRRAMSWNVKRLPAKLRAQAEKETNETKKPKRLRKKFRKRPKNKKLAYAKRQKTNKWLDTHVWHAKRFHMVTKWGYKLADYPTDKGFRAGYRASATECLMTDMSYLVSLELRGIQEEILQGLRRMTSTEIGRTFAYKDCSDGHLEGTCMLYQPDSYPRKAVSPVRFLWHRSASVPDAAWSLFIWAHPSVFREVALALIAVFHLPPAPAEELPEKMEIDSAENVTATASRQTDAADAVESEGLKTTTETFLFGQYRSESITLTVLKDQFTRFRLTGVKATSVLKAVLKPVVDWNGTGAGSWWSSYKSDAENAGVAERQSAFWNSFDVNPTMLDVKPGSVLGLVVRDPRIQLPKRKVYLPMVSVRGGGAASPDSVRLPNRSENVVQSPLWNRTIRQQVGQERVTDQQLNKLRSQLPAPGMELQLGERESKVPVVLVRNGGSHDEKCSRAGYGAGWDLVLPAGWSMSFWIPLVYNGARVGGQRELGTVAHHQGSLTFPSDLPDTGAGVQSSLEQRRELEEKFQRYPPNKRPNYLKLGVVAPFHCPWQVLVSDWVHFADTDPFLKDLRGNYATPLDFYVLRDLKALVALQNLLCGKVSQDSLSKMNQETVGLHSQALVAVSLSLRSGGKAAPYSMICIAEASDIVEKPKKNSPGGPVEPKHADPFRQNPVKERRKLQVQETLKDPYHVIDQASRKTIGYVVSAGFSFIRGHETGLGYCNILGLLSACQKPRKSSMMKVLIRNAHSFQYESAEISVLMSSAVL